MCSTACAVRHEIYFSATDCVDICKIVDAHDGTAEGAVPTWGGSVAARHKLDRSGEIMRTSDTHL